MTTTHYAMTDITSSKGLFSVDASTKRLILSQLAIPMALLVIGIWGGLMQVCFRAGVLHEDPVLTLIKAVGLLDKDYIMADEYYRGLTMHGVVNAIVFTTFFAVAFGNILIPYALRKTLNTTIAWIGNALMLVGSVTAAGAIITGNASVLYTFYPPLQAHWTFYVGATVLVIGSWVSSANWISMYVSWRKEHPSEKVPIPVVGMFTTFIVWFMATIPVAVEILFLLLPWTLGWTEGVNVPLARTLFWFFGHALVYFWLLPAYTMYYSIMPRLAGGKLFSDGVARAVFMMFVILSVPIGAHHQYADPAVSSGSKLLHAFFTYGVAIPSLLTAFTMAASLEYAAQKRGAKGLFSWVFNQPFFTKEVWLFPYLIAGLIIFIFGGISGIVNASYNMNIVVHNTSWMPGHFHMTVAGPVFLAFLGMSLYLLVHIGGKELRMKNLAMLVPYLWMIGLFIFSSGMMRGGLHGEPRRTNLGQTYMNPDSPLYRPEWKIFVYMSLVGGAIMFLAMAVYFVVFFGTLLSKKVRESAVEFPLAPALHNEPVRIFQNFRPWIILAVIMIAVNYTPVIMDALRGTYNTAPPFKPESAAPSRSQSQAVPEQNVPVSSARQVQ